MINRTIYPLLRASFGLFLTRLRFRYCLNNLTHRPL